MNTPTTIIQKQNPLHVLSIEDNKLAAKAITHLLAAHGIECTNCHTVEEASAAIDQQYSRYDVILLDLGVKETSGMHSLISVLRLTSYIPIVVYSGNDAKIWEEKCLSCGVQEYVEKGNGDDKILIKALQKASWRTKSIKKVLEKKALPFSILNATNLLNILNAATHSLSSSANEGEFNISITVEN